MHDHGVHIFAPHDIACPECQSVGLRQEQWPKELSAVIYVLVRRSYEVPQFRSLPTWAVAKLLLVSFRHWEGLNRKASCLKMFWV